MPLVTPSSACRCQEQLGRLASRCTNPVTSVVSTWAAWYNTWLLIKLTPKGIIFSFLFWSAIVLFDFRSPVALCDNSCCTVCSVIYPACRLCQKGLVNLLACVLIRSCELSAFVLCDLRSPLALCDNSCCMI